MKLADAIPMCRGRRKNTTERREKDKRIHRMGGIIVKPLRNQRARGLREVQRKKKSSSLRISNQGKREKGNRSGLGNSKIGALQGDKEFDTGHASSTTSLRWKEGKKNVK